MRHIIHRFRDKASLDAWENSEELRKLIAEVDNYTPVFTEGNWFRDMVYSTKILKAIVPPPKWKMAIVAFIGAYCISSVAIYVLSLLLGEQLLLINLFMNIILVIGLTYLAMPLLSRLLRRWLYLENS